MKKDCFINLVSLTVFLLMAHYSLTAQQPQNQNSTKRDERYYVTQVRDVLYHETPTTRIRSSTNTPAGLSCDLTPCNFKLYQFSVEDDCKYDPVNLHCIPPQPLEELDLEFLLDNSGSMTDKVDAMKNEIIGSSKTLDVNNLDVRFALITNFEEIVLGSKFTSDPEKIKKALEDVTLGDEDAFTLVSIGFGMQNLDFRPDARMIFFCIINEKPSVLEYNLAAVTQLLDKTCGMLIATSTGLSIL